MIFLKGKKKKSAHLYFAYATQRRQAPGNGNYHLSCLRCTSATPNPSPVEDFCGFFVSFPCIFPKFCTRGARRPSPRGAEGVNAGCEEGGRPSENSPAASRTSGSDSANNKKAKRVRWSSSRGPRSVTGHWLLASDFQLLFRQGARWKDGWR